MTLEQRNFQLREFNKETREVSGIAVPYGQTINLGGGIAERFEPGAIASFEDVKLFYGHSDPIGKVTDGRDTENGYEIKAKISTTPRGDEIYTLLKDGVLNRFSVGFIPQEHREEEDGTIVRTKVDLREVSVVAIPAYDGAKVSEVRAESNNATNQIKEVSKETKDMTEVNYDDSEIRSELEIVKRELAVVRENGGTNTSVASQYRSAGEFLKDYALGVDNTETRAYTGAVLADSHTSNDWKSDLLKILDRGRPLVGLFDKGQLSRQGNNVEYPKVSGITGDVAAQAAEGDDLAYLEVGVTTATAPVKTYGAYSELSRQVIERSDVAYLDAVLRAQVASYNKVTNAAVRTALTAATPQTGTSFTLSSATAASFTGAVVDAVQKIDANGYYGQSADFMLVSWDVYQKLAGLVDTAGRPVFDVNGDGSNTFGNVSMTSPRAVVAGMPVVVDSGLAAKSLYVANSHALTVWEDSASPIRLDNENVVNLTKVYSIYGYMACGVKDANGLVKATIA